MMNHEDIIADLRNIDTADHRIHGVCERAARALEELANCGDYTELVKALRCCGNEGCHECPYKKHMYAKFCWVIAMKDAAAAIEELQAEVERLKPKRGKWTWIQRANGGHYKGCSVCHAPMPTDSMLDYLDDEDCEFCYSCGAKMGGTDERRT